MTRSRSSFASRSAQRGQAMTEFVVGAVLFLLPMFLIIPTLGKYADVKAASAQSARYVAWERTVWYGGDASSSSWPGNVKGDAEIQNESRQRVVAEKRGIASSDKSATSFSTAGARAIWHNRNSSAMLTSYDDAKTGAVGNDSNPGYVTGDAFGVILSVTAVLGFELETKGFYTGNSAIAVKTLPIGGTLNGNNASGSVFDPGTTFGSGGKLTFRDRNVLLANGWSARGTKHVYDQTRGLTPLGILADPTLKTVIETVGCLALAAFVPEICGLELAKIEPDVVPPDRLTP